MKKILPALVLFLSVTVTVAQNKEGESFLYFKEVSGGFGLHSAGWNVVVDYSKIKDARTKLLYEFELSQIKHPKEFKQTQDFGFTFTGVNSPKPFVYGKQNSFYPLNVSVGKEKEIGRKAQHSGVSINLKYLAGVSLGILKPYYIQVLYPIDNTYYTLRSIHYTEENRDKFLDWTTIYGGAGFFQGTNQLSLIPGVNAKIGLVFDWANYDEFIKALEVGTMFNAYYKPVPIMVVEKNQQLFPNVYAAIRFGKRW